MTRGSPPAFGLGEDSTTSNIKKKVRHKMLHRASDFNGFFGIIYTDGTAHVTGPLASRGLSSLQWLAVHVLHTRQQNVFP
jgi:hypothetical protein